MQVKSRRCKDTKVQRCSGGVDVEVVERCRGEAGAGTYVQVQRCRRSCILGGADLGCADEIFRGAGAGAGEGKELQMCRCKVSDRGGAEVVGRF